MSSNIATTLPDGSLKIVFSTHWVMRSSVYFFSGILVVSPLLQTRSRLSMSPTDDSPGRSSLTARPMTSLASYCVIPSANSFMPTKTKSAPSSTGSSIAIATCMASSTSRRNDSLSTRASCAFFCPVTSVWTATIRFALRRKTRFSYQLQNSASA